MKGAILIFGNTMDKRKEEAERIVFDVLGLKSLNDPDLLIMEKDGKRSIGIGQAKKGLKFISEKPFSSKYKCVICYNTEIMTPQAQNALLKTLEELPEYASIILCSKTQDDVLPTILSRCQRINLKSSNKPNDRKVTNDLLSNTPGEMLDWALELAKEDRELVVEELDDHVLSLRGIMLKTPNRSLSRQIHLLTTVRNDITETNVNLKLALEYLATNFFI